MWEIGVGSRAHETLDDDEEEDDCDGAEGAATGQSG